MKKLILIGRSEAGKTTLTQAIRGQELSYQKTQYIENDSMLIDTPGEYIQTHELSAAIALYAYESDIVGLVASAEEPYSLFPPCITSMANREVIGIITKIDSPYANVPMARLWLENAGCETIFEISAYNREGIDALIQHVSTKTQKKPN